MWKYIILLVLAIIIITPKFIWHSYLRHRYSENVKDLVSKPFVCPNCGHRFYTQQKLIHPLSEDKAYLKCPACKKRDICTRPYDFEDN